MRHWAKGMFVLAASSEEAYDPRRQDHRYHPGEEYAVKDPRPSYGED